MYLLNNNLNQNSLIFFYLNCYPNLYPKKQKTNRDTYKKKLCDAKSIKNGNEVQEIFPENKSHFLSRDLNLTFTRNNIFITVDDTSTMIHHCTYIKKKIISHDKMYNTYVLCLRDLITLWDIITLIYDNKGSII